MLILTSVVSEVMHLEHSSKTECAGEMCPILSIHSHIVWPMSRRLVPILLNAQSEVHAKTACLKAARHFF